MHRPPLRAVLALAASVALAIAEDATCADLGCSTQQHDVALRLKSTRHEIEATMKHTKENASLTMTIDA